MTIRKVRKSRKLRGKISHGYGRTNKHRKHSGGRGACGGLLFKQTWFDRFHPDYFGKRGMNIFHWKKNATYCRAISLSKVYKFLDGEQQNLVLNNNDSIPVIDVRDFDYHVVIGGELPLNKPLVVRARYFTKNAQEEIKRVGGKAIVCP